MLESGAADWKHIAQAAKNGLPIAYLRCNGTVSTCMWLADGDASGWWDVVAEEPANPEFWTAFAQSKPPRRVRTRARTRRLGAPKVSKALARARGKHAAS